MNKIFKVTDRNKQMLFIQKMILFKNIDLFV